MRKKGSKTKERMKEEEIEKCACVCALYVVFWLGYLRAECEPKTSLKWPNPKKNRSRISCHIFKSNALGLKLNFCEPTTRSLVAKEPPGLL